MAGSSGARPCSWRPGGRKTRFENVWLVISAVTCRDETSFCTFRDSGSEKALGPR
jgi:hypothetical protein